ncbi:DUF6881 domain-containing protein [Pseudoduganella armeniaca]|uniref:DUF6881 domain-containing protein n=1 Tax=Pseudoduganella armeniaca TaxID=2072590 RepID=A0A2R4CD91_9BURK|nr:hypothetical protein [Pseudoduganella armeniaca]AVR97440.1 hypothetical protein C9I28_18680 [Pseudoduganella armeniaca]
MKYICVKWKHLDKDEPVLLYSELDDELWERRKVEVYSDGKSDYADSQRQAGNARLSEEPLPPMEQIALDPQFEPFEISKEEFEQIWDSVYAQPSKSI